ncbi:MAG: glycosyltransferase family 2 protein [Candidatus Krumholzibacteria bacterium]|nr:glycosyltransferase family 2 protein [Candidatus Krumholzibacteria bacterium]
MPDGDYAGGLMATVDLSIIIVNWNTRDLLAACLASLPAATAGLTSEIIVVDNDSRDGSAAMVQERFPAVQVVAAGANLGFARANNVALRRASGRNVLLLNPDTVCPPGSLAALAAVAAHHPECGGFGPLLIAHDDTPTTSCGNFPALRFHWLRPLASLPFGRRWQRWSRFTDVPRRGEPSRLVDYVAGACLLIPRDVLARVGTLDERFFLYFEETDWCLRAWRAGLPIMLCTAVEVIHLEGRAADLVSLFSLTQFQSSYRRFIAKHRGRCTVELLRCALFWEKGMLSVWHACRPWSARHRRLARRYAFEMRLQLRADIDPPPPVLDTEPRRSLPKA